MVDWRVTGEKDDSGAVEDGCCVYGIGCNRIGMIDLILKQRLRRSNGGESEILSFFLFLLLFSVLVLYGGGSKVVVEVAEFR